MLDFRNFIENKRPVCSFDFDGVLHRSVAPGTIHPLDFWDWEQWEPNETIHAQVRNEAKLYDIVVVSRRDNEHQEPMWEFIRAYKLPIKQIYTTNNGPKAHTLMQIGAIRHYDDDPRMKQELARTGIEFILVDPRD